MTLGIIIAFTALFINYQLTVAELEQVQQQELVPVDTTVFNELVVDEPVVTEEVEVITEEVEVNELPEIEHHFEHIESVPVFPNGDPNDR